MAGTKEGGRKAAATTLARNPNFYAEIGRKGGKAEGVAKGFAHLAEYDPEAHRRASAKGGRTSRKKRT